MLAAWNCLQLRTIGILILSRTANITTMAVMMMMVG